MLNNPDTYAAARSHLSRAAALLAKPPSSASISRLTLANYMRCVASVYHHLAAQLHQSGRYDHTVCFAEDGCRLAQRALQMYYAAKSDTNMNINDESRGKEESWIS